MKILLILLIVLVGFVTLGVTLNEEDSLVYWLRSQLIQEQAVRIQQLEAEQAVLREEHQTEVLSLKEELASAQGIVSAVESLESLEAQIASLTNQRNSIQGQVGAISQQANAAYAELNRVRAATASINTMVSAFTPDMGIVGCKRFPGVSMEPTFDANSLVCISNAPSYLDGVGIGDIVIGPAGCVASRHVIHRVVRKIGDAFVLKGDNPLNGEDPCALKREAVFYKVTGFANGAFW